MKIFIKIFAIVFLVQIHACIDPIPFEDSNDQGILVVDGLITDQPPPYNLKISRTSQLSEYKAIPETNAIAIIRDQYGNEDRLTEISDGVYQTNNINGTVGTAYTLVLTLSNGETYESLPEILPSVPEIEEFYYEYVTWMERVGQITNTEAMRDGFQVYVDTNDPEETQNFYRWKTKGTMELFSSIPAPGCCAICFKRYTKFSNEIVLDDDTYINGNKIKKRPILLLPNSSASRVYIEVEQYALTSSAYEFWKLVGQQYTNVGTIFDAAPAKIRGNIRCMSDPEKEVLGFFGASSVTKKNMIIHRSKYPSANQEVKDGDCRLLWPGATTDLPEEFL